jgi:hypothetical protein
MSAQDPKSRIEEIDRTLGALREAWPTVRTLLKEREDRLIADLIGQDNEQTRGRIKALRELMELPETLLSEREGISAGLAD